MNLTILPYFDQQTTRQTKQTPAANADPSFDAAFRSAKRALNAMTVDLAVAEARQSGKKGFDLNSEIAAMLGISNYTPIPTASGSSEKSAAPIDSSVALDKSAAASASNADASDAATAASGSAASISGASVPNSGVFACSEELNAYFKEASETYGVDVALLKAIAKAESNFQADAVSRAGAMGIMQLMPATAQELGVSDAYNAHDNILGGAKLISQLLQKYNGSISLALAAYNAGSGNVDKYGGIPPFTETQNYVQKIMGYLAG